MGEAKLGALQKLACSRVTQIVFGNADIPDIVVEKDPIRLLRCNLF